MDSVTAVSYTHLCVVVAEGFQQRVAGYAEVDGAGLGQLHHFVLGAQQFAGVDFYIIFVSQLALDKLFKSHQSNVRGMVGRLVVSNANDLTVVLSGGSAGRQHSERYDRRQCQRGRAQNPCHKSPPSYNFNHVGCPGRGARCV